ncbi:hypothetical protein RP20_CCG026322 [Aedes albopictus]|nr:uncharacterized protein LOC109404425 [Aedes albopictus]KXJ80179.1 hypothetical protein RP20_CCG026322 [Aedes albopictus]
MGQTRSRFHLDVNPFNLQRWQDICPKRLTHSHLKAWGFIIKSDGHCSSSNCPTCHQSKEQPIQNMMTSAMDNLLSVIADTGFQFAVKNLESGNYVTAVSHLKLGTRCHHPSAAFNLGLCYELGIGVRRELNIARQCFYLASNLGHPKAMYNLGVYYAYGLGGLLKSRKMAKLCFIAAAVLDEKQAIAVLESKQPHVVQQLTELEERVSPSITPVLDIISGIFKMVTMAFVKLNVTTVVIETSYIKNWKYHATIICKQKRQRIFQPRKMSGGLKYKIKTRLLEGQ